MITIMKILDFLMYGILKIDKNKFSEEELLRLRVIVCIFMVMVCVAFMYFYAYAKYQWYSFLTYFSIAILVANCVLFFTFKFYNNLVFFVRTCIVSVIACFFVLQIIMGGFVSSSGCYMLGIAGVIASMVFFGVQDAKKVFLVYCSGFFVLILIEFLFFYGTSVVKIDLTMINAGAICVMVYLTFALFLPVLEDQFSKSQTFNQQLELSNDIISKSLYELQSTQSQLVETEKMASLGQLVAGIAHEINTPIGAIKASSEFIMSTLTDKIEYVCREINLFNEEQFAVFAQLITLSSNTKEQISTIKRRKIMRSIEETFQNEDFIDPRNSASLLIEMDIFTIEDVDYIEKIANTNSLELIIQTAYHLSSVLKSSQNINLATQKITKIIFALKSYSHYDSVGDPVYSSIEENIDIVLTLYHNQIKAGVDIIKNYEQNISPILCYPDELNQVWTNIIHNALHAMSGEGTLTINITSGDRCLYVSFTDTGVGIPKETLENIFKPFFTTKARGEGTGLGLDISTKIINKHHGEIDVTSEVGKGTTFTIMLPIV